MNPLAKPVSVLIIDDSSIVRTTLERDLSKYEHIKVQGSAPDPYVARDMIEASCPDVLILDIEMPRMDGLTFLKKIMRYRPIPTIICSSLTRQGAAMAMACMQAGAVHVLSKPSEAYSIGTLASDLAELIRNAGQINLSNLRPRAPLPSRQAVAGRAKNAQGALLETTNKVIAVGSSTGGTETVMRILKSLQRGGPGILVAQHMPETFTRSFAERLNRETVHEVKEAESGDAVLPGRVLIAPGNRQLMLTRSGARYIAKVVDGPRVCGHRPSVEVLFDSVAKVAGANAMGVMLTGMGGDGSSAMLELRNAGAFCIAQDESSSVVFGMPREAIRKGAVHEVLHIDSIADRMTDFARHGASSLAKKACESR